MLNVALGLIKQLHDVKVQCDLDGSTHDEYLSRIAEAASEYDSGIVWAAVAESVQSIHGFSESVKSHTATDPQVLVNKISDEQDNLNVEGVDDNVIATGNCAICNHAESHCQYDPILPLYQLGYQLIPLVKLKGIHGVHGFLGTISAVISASSSATEQLLQLWCAPSLNGDSALMSQLPASQKKYWLVKFIDSRNVEPSTNST